MSVDTAGIRTKIAEVLSTITELVRVEKYEQRDRDDALLPMAVLESPVVTGPGINQPQPEFQRFGFEFTWLIKVYIPLDVDTTAETQADTLTMRLFDAFNNPANALAVSGLVQSWSLESVSPNNELDINKPAIRLDASLVTQAES